MKPYGIIYLLIDCTNDLEYVGQTVQTFKKRFRGHLRGNQYIDRVIRSRGVAMIETAILKVCYSKAELDYWEKHFIKYRNTMKPNGYNLTEGGEGVVGFKHTPEALAKMSAANSGANNRNYGQHMSPEDCSKISITNRASSPYKNLLVEIDAHHLSYTALAKLMGFTSHKSIAPKIAGKQDFTDSDKIKLPEIFGKPIDYLLARDEGTTCEEISASEHQSPYKNLLAEMEARQISCSQLAELLGLAYSTVVKKMRGNANFSNGDKIKLPEIFGKPIEYLLERDDGITCEETPAPKRKTPYKNLLAELDARQMTYHQLAELLGSSYSVVSTKMRGKQGFTNSDKIKLPEIFGKPIEYLLEREDGVTCQKTRAPRNKSHFKNLLAEMAERQMTYHQLAELLGSSYSTVAEKMRGNRDFTDSDESKLPEIFGKPIEYLLERDDGITCDKEQKRAHNHRVRLSAATRVATPFKNLLAELDARQLSYLQLAELLGLSKSNISEKMSGKHNFTERDKIKLVEIFGKPIDYLLARFD